MLRAYAVQWTSEGISHESYLLFEGHLVIFLSNNKSWILPCCQISALMLQLVAVGYVGRAPGSFFSSTFTALMFYSVCMDVMALHERYYTASACMNCLIIFSV